MAILRSPDGIYYKSGVDIVHYDPIFLFYLIELFNRPQIRDGKFYVNSGARSHAEQAYLYDQFLHHRGAPANQPGKSLHEWMNGKLAKAADINPALRNNDYAILHKEAAKLGFIFPYKSYEPWHAELAPAIYAQTDPKKLYKKAYAPTPTTTQKKEDEAVSIRFETEFSNGAKIFFEPATNKLECYGARFYGGPNDLKPEVFAEIARYGGYGCLTPVNKNDPEAGYILWMSNGANSHKFDPSIKKFLK